MVKKNNIVNNNTEIKLKKQMNKRKIIINKHSNKVIKIIKAIIQIQILVMGNNTTTLIINITHIRM